MRYALALGLIAGCAGSAPTVQEGPFHLPPTPGVFSLAFSSEGRWLALGCDDGMVRVYALSGEEALPSEGKTFAGHTDKVLAVAFSPDSKLLVAGNQGGILSVWDFAEGADPQFFQPHAAAVDGVAFSRDGRKLISTGLDGSIVISELPTFQQARRIEGKTKIPALSIGVAPVHPVSIAVSPDGQHFATSGQASTVVYNLDGKETVRIETDEAPMGTAFSPDGKVLAMCGRRPKLRFVEIPGGNQIFEHNGYRGAIQAVTFSTDGQRLAFGGNSKADRGVHIWDAAKRQELFRLQGIDWAIESVAFSPDGKFVAAAGTAGAKLWRIKE